MDGQSQKSQMSWWLSSLAISVVCCAVLFVIFAGFVGDLKKEVQADSAQIAQLTSQNEVLAAKVETLTNAISGNGVAAAAAANTASSTPATPPSVPTTVAIPTTTIPSTAGTATTVSPSIPAAEPTPANTPATVPAAAPGAVPEIPAK